MCVFSASCLSKPLRQPPSAVAVLWLLQVASKYFSGIEGVQRHSGILFGMGVDGATAAGGWDSKHTGGVGGGPLGPADNGMV
jgi:hypothetical protein